MKQRGLTFNSQPGKAIVVALGLMLGLCPVSSAWGYANVNDNLVVSQVQKKVKGQVVDAIGEPLIGVNVSVISQTGGTITDINGNYSLDVPQGAKLKFSYIGYKEQVIEVGSQSVINVKMQEDSEILDEVVIVGYGTQKKATMTGSVTVVSDKMLENKGTMSSPVQALQGQVPGVIITRNSSAPGDESWGMSLRGAVSKNTTSPLVIIDGVEYESVNELRLLNPSDIESINFLKDASASIYGSKAAGGVVLVTTKKAKEGKVQVDYSGSVTAKFIGLSPDLMNIGEWASAVIDARTNDGYTEDDTWLRYAKLALAYKNQYINLDHTANPFGTGAFTDVADFVFFDTNWQDIMWGTAASTQHELAISGGSDNSKYRLSLGYMFDDSNLKWGNNNNSRYNLRLTNTFKLSDKMSIESVIAYNRQDQVAPTQVGSALTTSAQQPGFPSATVDGKPYAWGTWGAPNWYCELGGDNKLKVSAINISETFNYSITKDLSASVIAGYNTSTATRDTQKKSIEWYNYAGDRVVRTDPTEDASSYTKSNSRTDFYSISGRVDWSHIFADVHDVKLMAGMQYNMKEYEYTYLRTTGILPSLEVPNSNNGLIYLVSEDKNTQSSKWQEAVMSYFGRANYNYRSKYMLEAQFRYDGSSKFQPENRWAFYWGTSGGWRLSEEDFIKELEFIDEFKLRASYGSVGNQAGIDRYDGTQLYNFKPSQGALIGNGKVSYVDTSGKLPSLDRTWERIHNYNIGLDFGFLNHRLTGTAEMFWKKSNNMLIDVIYPGILGDKAPTANYGAFKAHGWEGMINWSDRIGKVNYHLGGTFTYTTNELTDNGGSGAIKSGVRSDREGYPLNSVFGLRYCGKIQTEEQLKKYVNQYKNNSTIGTLDNLRLGDNMFEDVNKDGKLTEEDFVYLGTDDPKVQFSVNAGLEWKGLDLSIVFQGAGKRTVWREKSTWRIPMRAVYQNGSNQFIGNTWNPDNTGAYYPSLTNKSEINDYNYQCSSWSVEDGAYLRLKNVTLGYSLPSSLLAKTKVLSKARIYVTGSDLWEHSNINDGWDPEANREVDNAKRYPFLRTVTFGLNLTF